MGVTAKVLTGPGSSIWAEVSQAALVLTWGGLLASGCVLCLLLGDLLGLYSSCVLLIDGQLCDGHIVKSNAEVLGHVGFRGVVRGVVCLSRPWC